MSEPVQERLPPADLTGTARHQASMTVPAVSVMAGILAGRFLPWLWPWLVLSAGLTGVMFWMLLRGRERGVRAWGTLGLVAISASWLIVRADHTGRHELSAYVGESSQLAHVVGEIVESAVTAVPTRGAFVRFSYEAPSTRFVMRVDGVEVSGEWVPAHGDLLVRIDKADHRPRIGQRIEATGWLGAIAGPRNLGEFDFRQYMTKRGIVGRLTLRNRDNWRTIGAGRVTIGRYQRALRERCADAALGSLRIGMSGDPNTLGLLETMLLGRKGGSSREVRVAFRRVGLAHLLSISGAHLGILLGLVWLAARWFVPHPPRAAVIVLVVLCLYLMAVPLRVPIVRSAIMAGLFCGAYATGRQVRPIQVLSFAAVVVLLWRPMDLFSPGFQLSFAAVAGLVLFVRPVSDWLWPRPPVLPGHVGVGWVVGRWFVDYLSVSLVAFAVVFPLVAYHFQIVNPLSVLLSVMALPVLTAVLGLGYLKILIGLVLPSAGLILSGPLAWVSDSMLGLVDRAGDWPGASIELVWRPSVAWVLAMSALVIALLSGAFSGRRRPLVICALVMIGWTLTAQSARVESWLGPAQEEEPAALLTMFAVGDGSCYLLQLPGHTLMFDCGSQQYFDIAESSIVPALKRMGVKRIDTLVISHADMDHYGGSLDLADQIPVGRVLVPPQLLEEADRRPDSATAFLVDGLVQRGLAPQPVARGWSESIGGTGGSGDTEGAGGGESGKFRESGGGGGGAEIKVLWPPADFAPRRANDTSVVLSVRVAGRRILLNGDIQDEAINHLLELEDLNADITDLPHHGGIVDSTPAWLAAVTPTTLLQSSGRTRLYRDRWPAILKGMNVTRLVTARDGMAQVRISLDGHMDAWALILGDNAQQ